MKIPFILLLCLISFAVVYAEEAFTGERLKPCSKMDPKECEHNIYRCRWKCNKCMSNEIVYCDDEDD